MFKYLLALLIGLVSMTAMAIKPITLTSNNHVLLRGEINGMLVAKTMVSIAAMKTNNPILFIQSPGGEISAGNDLIQFMKDSGKHFTCIADMAASMAFAIFQACDDRYVTSNAQLMQHLAILQLSGPTANLKSQYDHIMGIIEDLEIMQADRIGKSLDTFRKDRLSDLWLSGSRATKYGAADTIVPVNCDAALWGGTTKESMVVMIFKIDLVYSTCPLARAPLSADMVGGGGGMGYNPADEKAAYEKATLMWTNFAKAIDQVKTIMFK